VRHKPSRSTQSRRSTVVDDKRLEVAERLGRDRRERVGEIRSLVSEGKENRDERAAQMPRTST
jgi:hypothetical protein